MTLVVVCLDHQALILVHIAVGLHTRLLELREGDTVGITLTDSEFVVKKISPKDDNNV
jgi:hypothetical protein